MEITGNIAGGDGGGIWIANLEDLTVSSNAIFSGNSAQAGYGISQKDKQLHKTNILTNVYTEPFAHAYNNYDVNYSGGELEFFTITEMYTDTDGNEIQPVTTTNKISGASYNKTAPDISGYKFVHVIIAGQSYSDGKAFVEDLGADTMVIFVYEKISENGTATNDTDENNTSTDTTSASTTNTYSSAIYGDRRNSGSQLDRDNPETETTISIDDTDAPLSDMPNSTESITESGIPMSSLPKTGQNLLLIPGIIGLLCVFSGLLMKNKSDE